jgi:hypothetical protein
MASESEIFKNLVSILRLGAFDIFYVTASLSGAYQVCASYALQVKIVLH